MFLTMLDFIVDDVIFGDINIRTNVYKKPMSPDILQRKKEYDVESSKIKSAPISKIDLKNFISLLEPKSLRIKLMFLLLLFSSVSFFFFRHEFFIVLFVLIGAVSRMLQKFIPLITGIDFCLFFAILVSAAYDPTLGILTGIISSLIGSFLRQIERIEYYLTPVYGYVPVWIFMSFPIVPGLNILLTGMICVALYVIARFVAILFTGNVCIVSQATYITTTVVFNYWLFSSFAPTILTIMVS